MMIRPMRETAIIPSEMQINFPSRLSDTNAPITTKRAANCMAENSPDRNENNRDFFRSPLLPAKAKIFSMFHTSDNTPYIWSFAPMCACHISR